MFFKKRYHYVPPCPRCGSKKTGRFLFITSIPLVNADISPPSISISINEIGSHPYNASIPASPLSINTLSTLGFKFSKIDKLEVSSPYDMICVDCLKNE